MNDKQRCPVTGKVGFWSAKDAEDALEAIARNPVNPRYFPINYFPCDHCPNYHLSSWTKERHEQMLESKRRNGVIA